MADTKYMITDGKQIANDIKEQLKAEVKSRTHPPTLVIFSVGENPVSEKFLAVKKRFAHNIGVFVHEEKFGTDVSPEDMKSRIADAARANTGIIVQLPLPKTIEAQEILDAIPSTHDIDVLSQESFRLYEEGTLPILPPVVGAIKEILLRHKVFVGNKNVVIVGKGKLVGAPAAVWFKRHQSIVESIDEHTQNPERYTRNADIIVSGAGVPGLIRQDMIKDGAVLLDAGTSESGGKLAGDIAPACAKNAFLFTPVPGGIGPVTVAMLFKNLMEVTQ